MMDDRLPEREVAIERQQWGDDPDWPWTVHIPAPVRLGRELTEYEIDAIASVLSGETAEQWRERRLAEGKPIAPNFEEQG